MQDGPKPIRLFGGHSICAKSRVTVVGNISQSVGTQVGVQHHIRTGIQKLHLAGNHIRSQLFADFHAGNRQRNITVGVIDAEINGVGHVVKINAVGEIQPDFYGM